MSSIGRVVGFPHVPNNVDAFHMNRYSKQNVSWLLTM